MENDELRSQLTVLHKQLETAIHKDPMDKDLLGHVMQDIVRIASGEDLQPEVQEDLLDQIEHKASDFELQHPRVAQTLREITEILSKLGI